MGQTGHRLKYAVWATIAFVIAYSLAGIFYIIFHCYPPIHSFHVLGPGNCHTSAVVGVDVQQGFQVLSDLIILALPWALIWHLQMGKVQKAGVLVTLCTGIL